MNDKTMFTLGLRYNFTHLANLKVQYSNLDSELDGKANSLTLSYAVGFYNLVIIKIIISSHYENEI
ncbi:MAG: hypothetical protein GY816_21445 [Cytophagales bacterium]|nr:hypothetical protein [Cytophagales bacterium]